VDLPTTSATHTHASERPAEFTVVIPRTVTPELNLPFRSDDVRRLTTDLFQIPGSDEALKQGFLGCFLRTGNDGQQRRTKHDHRDLQQAYFAVRTSRDSDTQAH
jgi:hypothetical protein